jgi:zinc D-Ala-D-Ala carboxypeptidase
MPLRMYTVAGIGLTLMLGACAPSETSAVITHAAGTDIAASPSAQLTNGPAPPGDTPFSIGSAITDTTGGYLPDGHTVAPSDVTNPVVGFLDPALLAAVQNAARAAAADGVDVQITSGWRTKGFQRRLFDDAVRTFGSAEIAKQYVASPDASHHVIGKAVDVGPAETDNWMIHNGPRFGLCQIYANEIWHFELAADQNGNCPALLPNAAG